MTAKEFLTNLPSQVPDGMLDDVETNFHFDISGEGGGQFAIEVSNGKMTVHESFIGVEKCKITGSQDNFIKVLSGKLNPMMAVLTGKIKISNQGELIKYAKVFGLM
ncbi:SCP2 sterol-binding domain-containing protein [bacterium]|jgi:putative sterol carrier protein|nr:SCP2 sterol-binding domain-containing protein [Bacteroidota bacterium]MDA7625720.1 SCP2 sterol-binding domain-containing protein [bacterium]MDF1866017.1 SCP2 sterol-binding domain-containing protein [Saprospiraceae bacterium]